MERDFPRRSRPAPGTTQPPVQWVPGLSRGQRRPGRDADHTPPSSAEVKKELSYTSTHPMGPPVPVTGFPFTFTYNRNASSLIPKKKIYINYVSTMHAVLIIH